MCGIAGFYLTREDNLDARKVSRALLDQIVTRGRDATGAAWASRNGGGTTVRTVKAAKPAPLFTGYAQMRTTARTAILHTRWATKGSPTNPLNNHPLTSGPVTGVHNGHLSNDDALFADLGAKRAGQVDSEAAMALLASTRKHPTTVLPRLRGRAALAWYDTRDRSLTLHLARVSESPLAIVQTKHGGVIFASTMPLLKAALKDLGVKAEFSADLLEGTYLKVRQGRIEEYQTFEPRPRPLRRLTAWDDMTDDEYEAAIVADWEQRLTA